MSVCEAAASLLALPLPSSGSSTVEERRPVLRDLDKRAHERLDFRDWNDSPVAEFNPVLIA
jgi:hypothetical protein